MSESLVTALAVAVVMLAGLLAALSAAVVGLVAWMLLRWQRSWGEPHEMFALARDPARFLEVLRARHPAPLAPPKRVPVDEGFNDFVPLSESLRHEEAVADAAGRPRQTG